MVVFDWFTKRHVKQNYYCKMTDNNTTPDTDYGSALAFAADENDFEKVKLLWSKGYKWSKNVPLVSAKTGNVDILRFAHENGCPWDRRVLFKAAECGNLAVLQYGIEQGLRCTADVSWWAGKHGQQRVFDWLKKTGKPIHVECKWMVVESNPKRSYLSDIACK